MGLGRRITRLPWSDSSRWCAPTSTEMPLESRKVTSSSCTTTRPVSDERHALSRGAVAMSISPVGLTIVTPSTRLTSSSRISSIETSEADSAIGCGPWSRSAALPCSGLVNRSPTRGISNDENFCRSGRSAQAATGRRAPVDNSQEGQGARRVRAMTEQRRRSRRYPTDWGAGFRFDAPAGWRPCRLIDFSWDGAALELYGVDDDEPLVGPIDVHVTPVTGSDDDILLRGSIRHRARTSIGRVIVGIELRRLSADEMQVLRLLVSLRAAV